MDDLVKRVVRLPDVPTDDEGEFLFGEGVTYATQIVAEALGIHPDEFSWDAATETFEGDARSIVGSMLAVINPEGGTLRARIEELERERDAWKRACHTVEKHRDDQSQALDRALSAFTSDRDHLAARLKGAEEALRKIANCGQTTEPDHWKFRLTARETSLAALARLAAEREAQP